MERMIKKVFDRAGHKLNASGLLSSCNKCEMREHCLLKNAITKK